MFRRLLFLCVGLWWLCALALSPVRAADDLALLWQNKPAAAVSAYNARLAKNPNDAPALLGLALVRGQQGDAGAALQAWERYYRLAPGSWQALAYWPQLVELAEDTGRWSALDSAARSVLATPGTAPALRASARLVLAQAALRAGKSADAQAMRAQLGYLRQWMIIGPFDNVSHSGFAKCYPPEQEIAFAKSYPGINDLALQWHKLLIVSPDGVCEVGTALSDLTESVFYAATAVTVEKAQPALLCFDPAGASQLYLNGERVHSDETYRTPRRFVADPYTIRVTLRAGANALLVKLVSNDEVTTAFRLRVTTPAGATLPLLAVDPAPAQGVYPATPFVAGADDPDSVTVAALRALPRTTETALALGAALRRSGDYAGAIDTLSAALQQTPTVGLLHWELSRAYDDDGQPHDAREAREAARAHHTEIAAAELAAMKELADELSSTDYCKRLQALQKKFPACAAIAWALSAAYYDADLQREGLQAARKVAAMAPGEANIERFCHLLMDDGQEADAAKVLIAALAIDPTATSLLSLQTDLYESQGKIAQAIAVYDRLLAIDTPWPWLRQYLARNYVRQKNFAQAAKILEYLRKQCPQNADVCAEYAEVLRHLNRKEEAVALYRRALVLDPSQVTLREKMRAITGEPAVLALAPAVPAEPLLAAAAKAAPAGASALVLLDEARQVVYPDSATEMHVHTIVKILTPAGASEFEYFPMQGRSATSDDTVQKVRLIKANGKVQDLTKDSRYRIAFPALEPGDIIDVSYRICDYQAGGLAKQFWTEWYFAAEDKPVALSRYVLITPAALTYRTRTHGSAPAATVKEADGWRIAEWRATDIPAQQRSPLSPSVRDGGSWLDISTVDSWEDIARWYRDLSGPLCVPDAAVRAMAAELTEGATTEREKIRRLTAFVAREIRYQTTPFRMSAYIPTKGKHVLRDRYGDCKDKATLLTALLAAVGIQSDIVLLSGRDDGLTPYLPSPRFNHAIACVQTAEGPLWIDATADQMAFGDLPIPDQGVPALIINAATRDLVCSPVLPAENNTTTYTYDLTLTEAGRLTGTMTMTATGNTAWAIRSALREVPDGKYEQVLRLLSGKMLPNTTFDSGAFAALDKQDEPVGISLKYHADSYAANAGDFLLLRLPWVSGINDLDDLLNVKGCLTDAEVADLTGHTSVTIRLQMPAGFAPHNLTPELANTSPWGSYRISYTRKGALLTARLEHTHSALRIPKADTAKFADFLAGIKKEVDKQLVLKKEAH